MDNQFCELYILDQSDLNSDTVALSTKNLSEISSRKISEYYSTGDAHFTPLSTYYSSSNLTQRHIQPFSDTQSSTELSKEFSVVPLMFDQRCNQCSYMCYVPSNIKVHGVMTSNESMADAHHFLCDICGERLNCTDEAASREHLSSHFVTESSNIVVNLDSNRFSQQTTTTAAVAECNSTSQLISGFIYPEKAVHSLPLGAMLKETDNSPRNPDQLPCDKQLSLSEKPYCSVCTITFDTAEKYQSHLKSHEVDKPYSCPQCHDRFDYNVNRIIHLYIEHGLFDRTTDMAICETGDTYSCMLCDVKSVFTRRPKLVQHLKSKHFVEEVYSCVLCKEVCVSKKLFDHHRWMHEHATEEVGREKRDFTCSHCLEMFAHLKALTLHQKKGYCPIMLSKTDKSAFMQMKRPLSPPPKRKNKVNKDRFSEQLLTTNSSCDNGQQSKDPSLLKIIVDYSQLKQLHNEKNFSRLRSNQFQCTTCRKLFVRKTDVVRHCATHSEFKPFKCPLCEKRFTQRINADVHLNSHRSKDNFHCHYCNKHFTYLNNCRVHESQHFKSSQKSILCEECCIWLKNPKELLSHNEMRHIPKSRKLTVRDRKTTDHYSAIHRTYYGGRSVWKCVECSVECASTLAFLGHMRGHREKRPYRCRRCHKCFLMYSTLQRHRQILHRRGRNAIIDAVYQRLLSVCTYCKSDEPETKNVVIIGNSGLRRHRLQHHSRNLQCNLCGGGGGGESRRRGGRSGIRLHSLEQKLKHIIQQHSCSRQRNLMMSHRHQRQHRLLLPMSNATTTTTYVVPFPTDMKFGVDEQQQQHPQLLLPLPLLSEEATVNNVYLVNGLDISDDVLQRKNNAAEKSYTNLSIVSGMECLISPPYQQHLQQGGGRRGFNNWNTTMDNNSNNRRTLTQRQTSAAAAATTKYFACGKCEQSFNVEGDLLKHCKMHLYQRRFLCAFCPMELCNLEGLVEHLQSHSGTLLDYPFQCPICTVSNYSVFESKAGLLRHIDEKHYSDTNRYRCGLCDGVFGNIRNLRVHIQAEIGSLRAQEAVCSSKEHVHNNNNNNNGDDQKPIIVRELDKRSIMNIAQIRAHTQLSDSELFLIESAKAKLRQDYSETNPPQTTINAGDSSPAAVAMTCGESLSKLPSSYQSKASKTHACHLCFKSFSRPVYLKEHIATHFTVKRLPCMICDKSFASKLTLTRHLLNIHHQRIYYTCHICRKQLSSKHTLRVHMSLHTGLKTAKCQFCDRQFRCKADMKIHLKRKHAEFSYQWKDATDAGAGKTLERIPFQDEAPLSNPPSERWLCLECRSAFVTKEELCSHLCGPLAMMTSSTSNSVDVGAIVTAEPLVSVTDVVGGGGGGHVCSFCGALFASSDDLQVHLRRLHRNHVQKRRNLCRICDRGFLSAAHLKRHLQVHSAKKNFVCKYCDKGFQTKQNLSRHCTSRHSKATTKRLS